MRFWLSIAALALCALPLAAQNPPADYTGLYSFLKDGESIQLTVQKGRLQGWVTSFGFLASDRDVAADRLFAQAELEGNQVHFVTQRIHGCWIEFSGTISRGDVSTRAKEGYYEMRGRLTEYLTDAQYNLTERSRDAVFKSFPEPDETTAER